MICYYCKCGMFNNRKPIVAGWGKTWNNDDAKLITYFNIELFWKCPECGEEEIEEIVATSGGK